jgi:hypothetical protein
MEIGGAVDLELKALLRKIEQGDFEDIPKLAEWLKRQNDPRLERAWEASVLETQEIADELVKIRSMRRSNLPLFSFLAEIALLGLFSVTRDRPLFTWHVESAPMTPRWWRPSAKKCLRDVEKALKTNVLPADIARAMRIARRDKADRLPELFQPSYQATALPPAPG